MTFVIGLTGGIGSGKSTVADYFRQLGVTVIDADQVAREVVEPNTPAWQRIVEHFGQTVLYPNGELNRAKLRELVFQSSAERQWLEQLLHPIIRQRMQEQLGNASSPYAIAMIPLLFETTPNPIINRTLVVHSTPEQQTQRVQQRSSLTRDQIQSIMESQLSETERLTRADDVIDNTGNLEQLKQQVNQLHAFYLELTKKAH